jgi:antitoxin (DNA-binding transcriptional repressor) of toxin-antitoxin stability system
MNLSEAERNFSKLVEKVYAEGVCIDLERDNKVIARLTPVQPKSPLTVGDLPAFLRSLPSLADDAESFAEDVRAIRTEFPAETAQWD